MSKHICFQSLEEAQFVDEIADKTYKCIVDNPKSIPIFRNLKDSPEDFKRFYREEICNSNSPYILVVFYDKDNPNPLFDEPVGMLLLGLYSTWFHPFTKQVVLNELCTVSFKKGAGIVRRAVKFMENYAKKNGIELIAGACANDHCAAVMGNGYKKLGFKSYTTFYKEII